MNIAVLVSGLPPDCVGGAELQASYVVQHLAQHHTVTVFTRTPTVPAELAALPQCTVVQRCRMRVRGVRFAVDLVRTVALIGRTRKTIDIIVAYQTVIDGLIGVVAKILYGIPVVVSVQCDAEYQLDRFMQSRLFSPFVFRHADRLTVQSPTIAEQLTQVFERAPGRPTGEEIRGKLCVIPNGISPVDAPSLDGDAVLYVGRLTKAKGVHFLIEAMRQCPDESLIVVGDGPERRALERAARHLTNVSFAGMVGHVRVDEYLARARVLVLPSLQEGQPNVVMEAMARGVPVIASRVGGVPDLVRHGDTGFLIEPGDIGAITHYIKTIAADTSLRARLAANCRREMQHYYWFTVIPRIERELLGIVPYGGTHRPSHPGPCVAN
jgi:glycosyltransferase involved in cell wall biosynthesis